MKKKTRDAVRSVKAKSRIAKSPGRASNPTRQRVIELDLVDLVLDDKGEPDDLHLLIMDELCKNKLTVEGADAMLKLHSRPGHVEVPSDDDDTADEDLEQLAEAEDGD